MSSRRRRERPEEEESEWEEESDESNSSDDGDSDFLEEEAAPVARTQCNNKRLAVTAFSKRRPAKKKKQSIKGGFHKNGESSRSKHGTNSSSGVASGEKATSTAPPPQPTRALLRKKLFNDIMTVGITGARAGDIVHGCAPDTANVVLRVDHGAIAAPACIRHSVEAQVGRDALVACLAKQFHLSTAVAAMKYNDCPISDETCPNHQPLGQACSHDFRWSGGGAGGGCCDCEPAARFTILNQGVWQSFAEEHGNGEFLQAMVQEGRSVCYRDVLQLMHTHGKPGGKTLVLRPNLFKIVTGPVTLSDSDPRLQEGKAGIIDASTFLTEVLGDFKFDTSVVEMEHRLFRLPASAGRAQFKDDLRELVVESLQGLELPEDSLTSERVQSCVDILSKLSVGGLKSLLQKTIRFHAQMVDMSLERADGAVPYHVPVALVAATAAGILFTEAGNFSPELQLYTRGCTSVLKRTAITLVEDAWVEHSENCVLGLMALALATQRMPEYEPPRCVVVATMRLVARAAESPVLLAWRKTVSSQPQNFRTIEFDEEGVQAMRQASDLLNIVKSFQGDLKMMESVAATLEKTQKFKLTQARPSNRLAIMPLFHCVDQHTYRGIGHVGPSSGTTFAERFRLIFGSCTGFNPRQATSAGFEEQKTVQEIRFAQRCIARFAFKVPAMQIPQAHEHNSVEVRLSLDSGTLAAAAGPIPVKVKGKDGRQRDLLVMLGVRCPEDETVMLKPARATRDLFGSLSDEERASAVSQARKQQLWVRSPVLKGARTITFENGCWRLDSIPWDQVVQAGVSVTVPLIQAPAWANTDNMAAVLSSDEALEDALMTASGTGLVPDAECRIRRLAASARDAVCLRAISMIRQQYVKVVLPVPALDGGLGSDQLAAYKGDWDVFRLLALVSRLAPGALRPNMPPNFTVVDANILRIVERWVIHGMRGSETSANSAVVNAWKDHPLWKGMAKAEQRLMEHQQCAVASMGRRDSGAQTGHFLIMDTGVGKTVTSLCYLFRWLTDTGGDVTKRIIWVTPKGTVENLVKQLRGTWSAPVWSVPRLSTAKKAKKNGSDQLILKDYYINVIHADHLRGMIDAGLAEKAPTSCCIFDEVDEMYAPTLRTSAARRLAQLCPKFVAQTATPMRKNESELLAWLSDTCSFPVDSKNMLVAASGMVSIQLELGIASQEDLLLVPMTDNVRTELRELLYNRQWLPMARLVQENTDKAMVKEAVDMAVKDRKSHLCGGVLMVADTKEHAEKLINACNATGKVRAGDFDTLDAPNADDFAIVVVPKDKDRGYNSACRLGAMVTGVYAGNGASRHQMRGRLRRLGQRRKVVVFKTVVIENSLLHLLHQRHDAVDSMNISLQELGETFTTDVLRALETSPQT